jgi:hypothetical protein
MDRQQSFGLNQSKMSSCETGAYQCPLVNLAEVGTSIHDSKNKNSSCTFFIHQTMCLVAIFLRGVASYRIAVAKMFAKMFLVVKVDASPHLLVGLVSPPIWVPEVTVPLLVAIFLMDRLRGGKALSGRIRKRPRAVRAF